METNEYIPFEPVHPYDILKDELSARGVKQKDFASRIGMQSSNFSRMMKEKSDITPTLALTLEKELGIPYSDWMYFQEKYLMDVKSVKQRNEDEAKAYAEESALAERINIKEVFKRLGLGLMSIVERMEIIRPYVKVIFNPEIQMATGKFKKSELCKTDAKNLLTWIVIALVTLDKESKGMEYIKGGANEAAEKIASLANSRRLDIHTTKEILNRHGICFVKIEKLDKTPIDAYSCLRNDIPCIAVTCRKNDLDKFAFDVIHELGHITLHMERDKNKGFIKLDEDSDKESHIEREADSYAQNKLIPQAVWNKIMIANPRCINPYIIVKAVGDNALKYGISPSIAVSRYKHESNIYNFRSYRSPKIM